MRFLVTLSLLISLSAKSQTTTEIYNYVTLGYATGLKQGQDFKQGYKYKEIIKLYFQFTEHSFIYFIRANISNLITIILNVFIGLFLLITIIRFIKSIFLFFKTQVLVKINNF